MVLLQQLNQISRCPCLKPITTEFIPFESIQETKRIINTDGIFHKMIAVIALTQLWTKLFIIHLLSSRKFMHFRSEIIIQLLFANTAKTYVLIPHRDIIQIVQVTENAHLAKLRNPRQHTEPDAAIHRFQNAIKRF